MKTKKLLIIAIALIIPTSSIAFGSQSPFSYSSFNFIFDFFNQKRTTDIPNHVLYDNLFRIVISLKKKADSEQTNSEKRIGLENYFKSRAGLNDVENQTLQSVALGYMQQVALLDSQAKAVIIQTRQANPNGVVPVNQPPPAELVNLQNQRNELALSYREHLKESMDADGFAKVEKFVSEDFASHIQVTPLSEINFDQTDNKEAKQ